MSSRWLWTKERTAALMAAYEQGGIQSALAAFPGKTRASIRLAIGRAREAARDKEIPPRAAPVPRKPGQTTAQRKTKANTSDVREVVGLVRDGLGTYVSQRMERLVPNAPPEKVPWVKYPRTMASAERLAHILRDAKSVAEEMNEAPEIIECLESNAAYALYVARSLTTR